MCCRLCSFDGPGGAGDYSEDEQLDDPDEVQVRVCVRVCVCVCVCVCVRVHHMFRPLCTLATINQSINQ